MRISLNLASRPFVELGPLYLRLRVLIAALALLAIPLWLLLRIETRAAAEAQARMSAIQGKLLALQQQQQSFRAQMLLPQNASVLQQSQFLNRVFARKAFSWTAVMMDLENVLPSGVQVLNLDPVISRNGDVTIRLRVSGQRDRAVELVRALEHSRHFLSPRLADESAETALSPGRGVEQTSAPLGVNFDILADYNPLPIVNGHRREPDSTAPGTPHTHPHRLGAKRPPVSHQTGAL
jgi:type IV pilus assembly protein PilN